MKSSFLRPLLKAVKLWYIPLLIGILFIITGIVALASPFSALLTLSIFFSIAFLLGGISEVIFSIQNRNRLDNWGWSLFLGLITLFLGLLLISNPELSVATVSLYVGFLVLFRSVAGISLALDIKRYGGRNWGWLLTSGILGTILSLFLIWNPLIAGIGAAIFIGLNFMFGGITSIIFSFQLRKIHRHSKRIPEKLRERYRQLQEEIDKTYG